MVSKNDGQSLPNDNDQTAFRESLLKHHTEYIREANGRATHFYQQSISQLKFAYWTTIVTFIISGITLLAILGVSLFHAFQPTNNFVQYFSAAVSIFSIILIVIFSSINPFKLARKSMSELIKINVIYTGYTRLIYQSDAEFKLVILEPDTTQTTARTLAKQIQNTIDQTISTLTIAMGEMVE